MSFGVCFHPPLTRIVLRQHAHVELTPWCFPDVSPSILQVWEAILGYFQRFVGQVSSFCFRRCHGRCVAYGQAAEWHHPSTRLSGYGQLDDSAWVEPQRPPRSSVGLGGCPSSGASMFVRKLHAETSHALQIIHVAYAVSVMFNYKILSYELLQTSGK